MTDLEIINELNKSGDGKVVETDKQFTNDLLDPNISSYYLNASKNVIELKLNFKKSVSPIIFKLKHLERLCLNMNKVIEIPDGFNNFKSLEYLELTFDSIKILPLSIFTLSKLKILIVKGSEEIKFIPTEIGNLENLKKLEINLDSFWIAKESISIDVIKFIPKSIGNLKNLVELDLYISGLQKLPDTFGKLNKLQSLRLNSDKIKVLPESIGNQKNLVELDLSLNSLHKLPDSFGELKKLKKFKLNSDKMDELPNSIGNLKEITELDLSLSSLQSLPGTFVKLKNLQKFRLDSDKIKKLPDNIGNLKGITELDLSLSSLQALPKSFDNLKSLKEFRLNSDEIKELPDNIGNLKDITELDLSVSSLQALPDSFAKLKNLKEFKFSSNEIKTLPDSFGNLKNLTELSISSDSLESFPDSLWNLYKITDLTISCQKLIKLSEQLGNLKKLYTLELSGSNLIALPNSFNNFKQLTKLSVRNTQINILPDSISKLENLEELDFSGNRNLEGDLPDCIYRLRKLEVLDFSNTSLSRINNNIAKLSKLIRIYFDDTNIYDLPDSITELQELTWLRLSSCKFQIIPESLAKLDLDFYRVSGRKRFIDISNNPFNSVFKKMIHEAKRNSTKLKSAVLKYYSDRREKEQKLYELKLILVGHGLVGKTVLANVLLNKETSNGKEEHPERTVVDIHSWILKKEILNRGSVYRFEDDLKINLWDFGGQEKYVYNHQLFFTPNTIYLLVTDTVSQDRFDDVNYWLPMINSLAPNSPILLVVNKSDVDTKNIPIKALQEKYKQINSSIHVSALKGTNIEELKQRIISIVQKDSTLFERMQKILPKHWQKVKSKLLSKKEKTMDKKEFDSICIDSGITDSESILSLLNYFHESGIVYHIDDGLGSVILLDLNWITEKINLVFSSEMINKNKGKISREEIFEILGKDKSITIDFISLVEHPNFDLFYKIQNTHNYVTPHLLPNEKLREAYLPDTKFICRYNFDFALTRIIHKFIVQMHSKIYKDIVWRFGLLIKENNTFVLIEQEQESGTIYVRMSSHDENFYNSINQKFRDIIKEILKSDSKNFFYHEIACNCDECSKKFNLVEDKPYYFNQRLIEKLKKDGKSSLQCQSSGIVIDLNKLMNGVQSMEDKNKGGVNVNVSGNLIMNDSASIGSKITGISSIDLESLIKTILNLKTDKNLSDDERIQKISEANDKIVVPDKKFYEGQVKSWLFDSGKLHSISNDYLVSGTFLLETLNKQTDKYDYAPALVQFSRAIENELREKFFTLYETTTGNQAPLSDKLQTLGRIKDQLRLAANSNPSLTDFKNFLDSTYNSSLIYNEDSFLKRLEVIADKRNKSCHPGTLFTQEMAESAIGEVKRFLSYWTNVIK